MAAEMQMQEGGSIYSADDVSWSIMTFSSSSKLRSRSSRMSSISISSPTVAAALFSTVSWIARFRAALSSMVWRLWTVIVVCDAVFSATDACVL